MFNIQGGELILLAMLALIILGPSRLPEYAARLGRFVRELRTMAEGAKSQIKEEMGPAFDDVDWRQLDPRQYDPRRIVREALTSPAPAVAGGATAMATDDAGQTGAPVRDSREDDRSVSPVSGAGSWFDPALPVPFDVDAT